MLLSNNWKEGLNTNVYGMEGKHALDDLRRKVLYL
jgi:hypothetical protein